MNAKGQSLIEALVALGVAVVIISAVAISVITAVNNADSSKIQNQANAYAQDEMEALHQKSRADWAWFKPWDGTFCVGDDELNLQPSSSCDSPNIGTLFIRKVDIRPNNILYCSSTTKVSVTVSWRDGKCQPGVFCRSTMLESCFTDANFVPTP